MLWHSWNVWQRYLSYLYTWCCLFLIKEISTIGAAARILNLNSYTGNIKGCSIVRTRIDEVADNRAVVLFHDEKSIWATLYWAVDICIDAAHQVRRVNHAQEANLDGRGVKWGSWSWKIKKRAIKIWKWKIAKWDNKPLIWSRISVYSTHHKNIRSLRVNGNHSTFGAIICGVWNRLILNCWSQLII